MSRAERAQYTPPNPPNLKTQTNRPIDQAIMSMGRFLSIQLSQPNTSFTRRNTVSSVISIPFLLMSTPSFTMLREGGI